MRIQLKDPQFIGFKICIANGYRPIKSQQLQNTYNMFGLYNAYIQRTVNTMNDSITVSLTKLVATLKTYGYVVKQKAKLH